MKPCECALSLNEGRRERSVFYQDERLAYIVVTTTTAAPDTTQVVQCDHCQRALVTFTKRP